MNPATIVATLLALAMLAGSARLLWRVLRAAGPARPRPWRVALLLLGPAAAALLLYLAMFPPPQHAASTSLTVITAGADAAQLARLDAKDRVVALPEAPAGGAAERVPDLATALRRWPAIDRLKVIGAGLPRRDLDVASRYSVDFEPAPLPRGVVELWSPRRVPAGSTWRIAGRVHGVSGATVDLLDPSQRRVARAAAGADGRFAFKVVARTPGRGQYRLRVLDPGRGVIDDVDVPVVTVPGSPLRVLVLAGAPGPELKYLRRWALDAGAQLHSEMLLRPGVRLLRSATRLDVDALRDLDVVILDERAWLSLDATGRRALVEGLRDGLGIVLRITGTLPDRDLAGFRELGFEVRNADLPRQVRLAGVTASLSRRPVQVAARDGVPLLRDTRGEPLALWRAEGQGRIALWWLGDSFRIALDGAPAAHGSLWSSALTTLARAHGAPAPEFVGADPRVRERHVICGLVAEAGVRPPDGRDIPLLRDGTGCAAYWPEASGWHVLRTAHGDWPFHVRARDAAPGLLASELHTATAAIAAHRGASRGPAPAEGAPGSPWPYFLGCLAVLAATWWLERSRLGRA